MTVPTGSDELTRKQRREQARAERRAKEAAERARAARRKRMNQFGGALVALIVVAVVAVVAAGSGGSSHAGPAPGPTASGTLPGLQISGAPWTPEYNGLALRLQDLNLPSESDAAYHQHAHLQIYVNGKPVTVPAQIGIDPQGQFLAPLHTHDTTGVIHMESSQAYPFKLGQFFDVWGVRFTPTQLGGYTAGNGNVLVTYVNGTQVPNGPAYVLKPHDLVLVAYGKPGSFPTSYKYTFAPGL
jgi:hypothetical protein